jgi:glycosyltransferase involved in cell wall biosynthesis
MRIGIDARELCGRATGVGRYLGGLLQEWARGGHAGAGDFVLYAPEAIALPLDARKFRTRIVPGRPGTWWEQVTLPREARADSLDVWFAPGYTAPLRLRVPVVVAIHDLSFVAHPEWFTMREGARRRWMVRQTAAAAAAVITISEFSRRELIERLDVDAERISIVPPGVGTGDWGPRGQRTQSAFVGSLVATRSQTDANIRSSPPVPQSPRPLRVLYVGSIFNRRHVVDLIRAFAPIARNRSDVALDIVGDNRSYPHQDLRATIAGEGLSDCVQWHAYVADEELHAMYARARAFAFLSEYEGLGLTPLEALAAGVPPVLLDTPVARESCGPAAVYVPVNDLPALTRALESTLFDDRLRAALLAAAPAALAKYSWTRAAADTLAVLQRAAAR